MAKPGRIQIEMDGMTANILPSSVDVWTNNGWTVVEDGNSGEESQVSVEADTPSYLSESAVEANSAAEVVDDPDETKE